MNYSDSDPKPSNKNRKRAFAVGGGAALLASAALAAGFNSYENQSSEQFASPEQFTPLETAARAEANQVFEAIETTDLVKCNVTEIASGPMMLYQGESVPSIKLSMDILPGDKINEPWFQKHKVGNYEAKIMRRKPSVNVSQNFNPDDEHGPRDTGVAILTKDFDPDKSYDPFDSYSTETDNSSPTKIEVLVALNDIDKHSGERMIEARVNVSPVTLSEESNGKSIAGEIEGLRVIGACAQIKIDLPVAGEPYISSAKDMEGNAIPVKQ